MKTFRFWEINSWIIMFDLWPDVTQIQMWCSFHQSLIITDRLQLRSEPAEGFKVTSPSARLRSQLALLGFIDNQQNKTRTRSLQSNVSVPSVIDVPGCMLPIRQCALRGHQLACFPRSPTAEGGGGERWSQWSIRGFDWGQISPVCLLKFLISITL